MENRADIANESNRKLYQNHLASMAKLREARLRIEALESRVELLEGYLRGSLEIIERFVACDTAEARAALEGKDE